ncbi:uncharacterized protein LOC108736680 [Agrilus planipennis]|uniref:Uncharacterized protein LOC108736680 n=1 Tax=Agrilus planipennis TaxID=224129 RepID=A0A7F5R743_AGRPL|nr:uncharacterized protein LOC108736680 [Agrilus planipennis]
MYETPTKSKEIALQSKLKECSQSNLIRIPQKVKPFRNRKVDKIILPTKSKFALNVASSKGSSSLAISLCTRQSAIPCQLKRSISCPSFNKPSRKAFHTSWDSVQKTVLEARPPCSTSKEISKQSMARNRRQTEGVSTMLERPDHGDIHELNSEEIRQMLPLQKRVQGNSLKNKNRMMASTRKTSTVNDFVSYQSTSQKESIISGSSHGASDVYRHFLGPTPDETIMAGLQTFIDMCRKRCSSSTTNGTDEDGLTASSDYYTKTEDDYLMKPILIDTMTDNNNNSKSLQSGDSPRRNNSMLQLNVKRNEQCWYCNEYPKHYQPQRITGNEEYCSCSYDQCVKGNTFSDKAVIVHSNNDSNLNTHSPREKLLLDNGCQVINSKEAEGSIVVTKIHKPQSSAQTIDVPISVQGVQTDAKYEEDESIILDSIRPPYQYLIGDIDTQVQMFYKPECGDITENIYQTSSDYKGTQQCNPIPELDYEQTENKQIGRTSIPKTKPGRPKKAIVPSTIVENTKRKPLQFASFLYEPYNGDTNNDESSVAVFRSAKYKNEAAYSKKPIEKLTIDSFEHEEGQIITFTEKDSTTSDDEGNRQNSMNTCRCLEIVEKLRSSDINCKIDESKSAEEIVIGIHTVFEEACQSSSGVQKNNSFHISFPKGNFPSKIHLTAKMCVNHDEVCENNKLNQKQVDVPSIPEEYQDRLHINECKSNYQLELELTPTSKEEMSTVHQVKRLADLHSSVTKLNQISSCNQSKLPFDSNLTSSKETVNSEYLPKNTSDSGNRGIGLVQHKKRHSKSIQMSESQHTTRDSKSQCPMKNCNQTPEKSNRNLQVDMNNIPSQTKHLVSENYSHSPCLESNKIYSKSREEMQEVTERSRTTKLSERNSYLDPQPSFCSHEKIEHKLFSQCSSHTKNNSSVVTSENFDGSGCTCRRNLKHNSKGCQCENNIENGSEREMNIQEFEDAKYMNEELNVSSHEAHLLSKSVTANPCNENNYKVSKLVQYSNAGDLIVLDGLQKPQMKTTHDEYYAEPIKDNIFQNDNQEMLSGYTLNVNKHQDEKNKKDNKTETHVNRCSFIPGNSFDSRYKLTQSEYIQTDAKNCSSTESRNGHKSIGIQKESHNGRHQKGKSSNYFKQILQTFDADFSSQYSKKMHPQNLKPRSHDNMKDNSLISLKNIPKSRSYQKDLLFDPNNTDSPCIDNMILTSEYCKRSRKRIQSKESKVLSNKAELDRDPANQLHILDKDIIKGAEEIKALAEVVKKSPSKKKTNKKHDFRVCSSCLQGALTEVYKAPENADKSKYLLEI